MDDQHLKHLKDEIEAELAERLTWKKRDWRFLQIIAWSSLLCSFMATVLVSSGDIVGGWRFFVAALTATPALMVSIESGFRFSDRYKTNANSYIQLKRLRIRLMKGENPQEIEEEFFKCLNEYESRIPNGIVQVGINTNARNPNSPST